MINQTKVLLPEQEQLLDEVLSCTRSSLTKLESIRSGREEIFVSALLRNIEHEFIKVVQIVSELHGEVSWIERSDKVVKVAAAGEP